MSSSSMCAGGSAARRAARAWARGGAPVAAALVALAACKNGSGSTPDAAGASWWQPHLGEARNWDLQLGADPAKIDLSENRTMYLLDLWAVVPSPTKLDYGDGDPVTVPAGPLAGAIAELHARMPRTQVICQVATGALDLALPDAAKFPGYQDNHAAIPDNPTPPQPGSVIGWKVFESELRWLDERESSRLAFAPIVFKRFELAHRIGCDGVAPSGNFAGDTTGFTVTAADRESWHGELARQAHARGLSVGMLNVDLLATVAVAVAPKFDWAMIERCGEAGSCDFAGPFIGIDKAVLAVDYDHDSAGVAQSAATVCAVQKDRKITDGLYKDVPPTKAVRYQCVP